MHSYFLFFQFWNIPWLSSHSMNAFNLYDFYNCLVRFPFRAWDVAKLKTCLGSNSSNTSRTTSSDFQTPRGVEIARQSQTFSSNSKVFWYRRRSHLVVNELTSKPSPISRENLGEKIWLKLCYFFLRFSNTVQRTDFLCFRFVDF